MDTETLLEELTKIFPNQSQEDLLDALVDANGDLNQTINNLIDGNKATSGSKKRRKKNKQQSLTKWISNPNTHQDPQEEHEKERKQSTSNQAEIKRKSLPENVPSINDVLKDRNTSTTAPATVRHGVIDLPTDEISNYVPCSLIKNILPSKLADELFLEMIKESQSWDSNKWNLAGRDVVSPHKTCFYVCPSRKQDTSDDEAVFWYNGRRMQGEQRVFNDKMLQARNVIEPIVNEYINHRKRFGLEYDGPWKANVAASNRYTGSKENVGWHSDSLTYLGPYPTIASLSLGCTRSFRLRDPRGNCPTYQLSLPHNSLVIMHAGCQERFKHCAPPQSSIDVFRPPTIPDSKAYIERINITFRFYRPDFNPTYKHHVGTPKCNCGVPCILRPDAKGKAAKRYNKVTDSDDPESNNINEVQDEEPWSDETLKKIKFFWMCNAGTQNAGKSCGMFQFLDMKTEKRGPCIGDHNND